MILATIQRKLYTVCPRDDLLVLGCLLSAIRYHTLRRSAQDKCVKIFRVGYAAPDSNRKRKSMIMYNNELGALVRVTEASIPGVGTLVASTNWNRYPAFVLKFHGE